MRVTVNLVIEKRAFCRSRGGLMIGLILVGIQVLNGIHVLTGI